MSGARATWRWAALATAVAVPIAAAAASPLLAWRDPVYIAAGFAGVVAMALLLVQPLLAGGYLPGLGVSMSGHCSRGLRLGAAIAANRFLRLFRFPILDVGQPPASATRRKRDGARKGLVDTMPAPDGLSGHGETVAKLFIG